MNDLATHQQTTFNEQSNLGDLVKTLMVNSILLQVREGVVANTTSSEGELQELVKQCLPPNCRDFSIIPVGPGGRFKNLARYLLVWSSVSKPDHPFLPSNISNSAVNKILQATAKDGSGYSMRPVMKREYDRMVVCLQKVEDEKLATLAEHPRFETMGRIIQEVFGQPEAQPQSIASPLPAHTGPKGTESNITNTQSRSYCSKVDKSTREKEEERTVGGEIGEPREIRGNLNPEQRTGPELAVGGSDLSVGDESGIESLRPLMALLAVARIKKGPAIAVKLVRPPPSHPTTSVLRPVVGRTPSPELEKREEHKKVSPSEYTSSIGNAEIVRSIYLEARTTGTPRTHQEERARRKRAGKIALKEICDVVDQVEWDRRGRNFQDGPFPVSMEGVDQVPQDDRRDWILERREGIRRQRCETRVTVWDNTEAAEHIWAVVEAVVVCFEAGKEGVVFE